MRLQNCDAVEDKLGTEKFSVTDENGHHVKDEEGNIVMKSINDEWHLFFREGLATAPAMLFSLTESWCQSPDSHVELVWNLVLKSLGAEELLRTETAEAKVDDIEADDGQDDLRKEDVLRRVEQMQSADDRAALFDGCFFLMDDEYSTSSKAVRLLLIASIFTLP